MRRIELSAGLLLATLLTTSGCEIKPVVEVYPRQVSVSAGSHQQFSGMIGGMMDAWVTYSVQEGPAGGTIDERGLYNAPKAVGTYHIVVTSVADPTRFAVANVSVIPPPPVQVSISPQWTNVYGGGTVQFFATVTNTENTQVTWTVVESDPAAGTVSAAGLYTSTPTGGVFHVRATSVAEPSRSATAEVQVQPPVSGFRNLHYVTDQTEEVRPVDLRTNSLAALVVDGSGFVSTYPAIGFQDGTFVIPGVPEGEYLLRFEANRYLVTYSRQLDLSNSELGRSQVEAPLPDTTLSVSLDGLAAWEGHDLAFTSAGAGVGYAYFGNAGAYPDWGSTTLNATVDYGALVSINSGRGLVASGDDLVIHQLQAQQPTGAVYDVASATRALRTTALDMVNGQDTPLVGTLSPLAQRPLSVSVPVWALANQSWAVNPGVNLAVVLAGVGASPPGGRSVGPPLAPAELFWANIDPAAGVDQQLQYSYGNPFPGWSEQFYWVGFYQRQYFAPGASTGTRVWGQLYSEQPRELLPPALSLSLSPVGYPTVDSNSFQWDGGGISQSPYLSWSSPSLGWANGYEVIIYRLGVDQSQRTTRTRVASFLTQNNWLRVPRGLISTGDTCFFVVRALQGGPSSWAPYRYDAYLSLADAMSGSLYVNY
ncbi:MAG: Ig-like domain-containing protein [Myxococcota bacterium]|nr:Ig-like domain-containing protein [Myxococcota bacterium]